MDNLPENPVQEIVTKNRKWFIFEAIIFILLGMTAIIIPGLFTLAIELLIGWLFVIGGAVQAYRALTTRGESGWIMGLLSSILSIVIGILLLSFPYVGILSLTLLLTIFFILGGIFKIGFAFNLRPTQGWGWVIFSAILSFIMAGIIISGWPQTALWVIGLLVGIDMIFFGFSLLSMTYASKAKSP